METFIRNHIPVEIITNGIDGILNKPVVLRAVPMVLMWKMS